MLTTLYGRIARTLPTSVKRFLKSMMIVHASPTETLPGQQTVPSHRSQANSLRSEADRLRNRANKMQKRLDNTKRDRRAAVAQRDKARRELGEVRRRLTKVERDTAQPADQWWEQRLLLAGRESGIGLRDYAYFPGGAQNPYLRLIYSRLAEVGFDPRPLGRLEHIYRLPAESVFHLHWTRVAQLGATTLEDAEAKTADFLAPIEDFVSRGGTLLWSIHEALPHDCPFPAVERKLRARLAELAAAVHVLHEATLTEIQDEYMVPHEKVFVVEHPLYTGAYERVVPRTAARRLLGIQDHEAMLLCLGAIRPYKGFDRLVARVSELESATGKPVRVMIAGPTMASIDLTGLFDLVEKTKGATISAEAVPDQQLHVLLEAADVVALPYRAVLNSGVLMLGVTFEKLCVAPENAVTVDAAASGLVELFDATDDESLIAATATAVARSQSHHTVDAGFADRYAPGTIAGRFAAHVDEIVGAAE